MKIFTGEQIRKIDGLTVVNEPILPVALMERAAGALFTWIIGKLKKNTPVYIFCGPGNNGGDGLALARLLFHEKFYCKIFFIAISDNTTEEWRINRERLNTETSIPLRQLITPEDFPSVTEGSVIVDAIVGSGLSRPLQGLAADVIQLINSAKATVVSIDIPSGLAAEENNISVPGNIVKADFTLSFEFPKLSFMFPENEQYTGEWIVLPIGLHQDSIKALDTPYSLIERTGVASLLKKRRRFSHKGDFGHGLFVGGSQGKMGAVVLGSKAALRTGIGLITCHIPAGGNNIIQTAVPEAMVLHDKSDCSVTQVSDPSSFDAVAVGPGLGTLPETRKALFDLISACRRPMVIDADALNILSLSPDWLKKIPEYSILTPHPKEFERIAGKSSGGYERVRSQMKFAEKYRCFVVLKGSNTSIASPDGKVVFNSTGNPGMATAGSGDVLTGMILSLLAQGYDPSDAALSGVFLHGFAGDIAVEKDSEESLIAADIIENIGSAFSRIKYVMKR